MRISELSRDAGVPVATIKYYLRERLLPEGVLTSPTQAQYDTVHVDRLRLIRALLGPGGLSVAAVRRVLGAIDEPPEAMHELLGAAHEAASETQDAPVDRAAAIALCERLGWRVSPDCEGMGRLAESLAGLEAAGFGVPEGMIEHYAATMRSVAEAEIAGTPQGSVEEVVRYVVLGTVLVEPLLLALRRLAQQDAALRTYDP